MKHINIFLIRHGFSCGNAKEGVIGQENESPLTDLGVEQAALLAKRLQSEDIQFDKIFSSTYKRAKQTAEILFPKSKIIFSDALVEYSPGDWRGKERAEIFSDPKNVEKMNNLQMDFVFPNGESLNQVARRMSSFIETNILHNDELLAKIKDKKANVAVISHGQSIKTFLKTVMDFNPSFCWKLRIENTSITKLKYHPNKGWFIRSINDIAHLKNH
jgi:probable phosphoglycerate mutase